MIKLISAEIENFRSITSKPLNVQFKEFTSIIGPNNCGKSNILRSLQLFFTGGIEDKKYDTEIDFPKNPLLPKHAQTKITVTVSYEPNKETILERALTELEAQKIQRRLDNDLITLRLSYSKNGVESWQFIGKLGSRNINKEAIYRIRDALRQSVIFKYLPIGRDSIDSVTEEIGSDLIRTIFSGWSGAIKKRQEINESIFNLVSKLKPELESSSTSVTQSMAAVFPEIQNLELQLPFENLEQMLPSLKPVLKDSAETGLKSKGAGIQTSSLLFLLKYLADNYPQKFVRATFIWAIEEPESFLHPAKQRSMAKVLTDFSKEVQTIITTHCPHFVPRDTISSCCYVIDKDTAQPWSTEVISQNYTDARKSLGVTLLDSMSLYPINIVIEGPSDEIYLSEALKKISSNELPNWYDIKYFPSGNATSAALAFEWMKDQADDSTNIILIMDGDKAGNDALNKLTGRSLASGKDWKPNKDYFQLAHDIEELLSNRVKLELKKRHPSKIQLICNTSGKITKFSVSDGYKKTIAVEAIQISEVDDLKKFYTLFEQIKESFI